MSELKFKIGDEVVTGKKEDHDGNERFEKGTAGTIINVDNHSHVKLSYCVEDEQGDEWWYREDELRSKNEEFKVGDTVRTTALNNTNSGFPIGSVGEVVKLSESMPPIKIKVYDHTWWYNASELEHYAKEEISIGPDDTPIDTWPIDSKEESQEGSKFDQDKIRMELLSPEALEGIAEVLTFGSKKYGDRNWEKGIKYSRVFGAIMRHLWSWWKGEKLDPETGLSHLSHAACGLMFLQTYEARSMTEFDDSPKTEEL